MGNRIKIAGSLIRSFFHAGVWKDIEEYVIFLGAPRSGSTMIAEFINAHRNAHISTKPIGNTWFSREHAYQLALDHFQDSRNGRYSVRSGYQGVAIDLKCVGIKNAPRMTHRIGGDIEAFFEQVSKIDLPVRTIHVYRDPIENIAKIARYNKMSISDASRWYLKLMQLTIAINNNLPNADQISIRHESLLAEPETVLVRLLNWLNLVEDKQIIEEFCEMLWKRPSRSARYAQVYADVPAEVRSWLSEHHPFYLGQI